MKLKNKHTQNLNRIVHVNYFDEDHINLIGKGNLEKKIKF